jgi:hypothetical protein
VGLHWMGWLDHCDCISRDLAIIRRDPGAFCRDLEERSAPLVGSWVQGWKA